jgi:hypothetical protein
LAPFGIVTSGGSNYFLKLVDQSTNQDAVGLFVRGGEYLEVTVPLGSYELRYATRLKWSGEIDLFGPETTYFKADETLTFMSTETGYSGVTVELIRQAEGNLETYEIPKSAF